MASLPNGTSHSPEGAGRQWTLCLAYQPGSGLRCTGSGSSCRPLPAACGTPWHACKELLIPCGCRLTLFSYSFSRSPQAAMALNMHSRSSCSTISYPVAISVCGWLAALRSSSAERPGNTAALRIPQMSCGEQFKMALTALI